VPSGRLPPDTARHLAAAAAGAGARLLLVRRPAGARPEDGRWVFSVDSAPGRERVLARRLATGAQLAALEPPYGPEHAGWQVVTEPLWLVCTHGRHDRCCALRGRPVAQALAVRHPTTTWECSHIGGDRFAANLLALPAGYYFGRVTAAEVVALADGLLAGQVVPELLRGRSSLPSPVQAAQHFARARLGRVRVDDLALLQQTGEGPDRWRVRLGGAPQVEVVVGYDRAGDGGPQVLTCGAAEAKTAPVFRLVDLQLL